MKSSLLAFAGILCILEYAYTTPLQECTDAAGFVYILQFYPLSDSIKHTKVFYEIVGASGASPFHKISEQPPFTGSSELARFPVQNCMRAYSDALDAGVSEYKLFDPNIFYLQKHQQTKFSRLIESAFVPWTQVNIPPTSWIQPCKDGHHGYLHILYMLLSEEDKPPFFCIKIFESSQEVANPMPMFNLVKLPLRQVWTEFSRYYSYEVNDCAKAIGFAKIASAHYFPYGYWKDYNLYGEHCSRPNRNLGEDLPLFKKVVEEAVHHLLVKPTESPALIETP